MVLDKFYKYFRILSLDVVIGACASSLFVASYWNIEIDWISIICLGLAVWLLYTTDHLIDARAIPHLAQTDRHKFHQRYFRCIFSALIIMAIVEVVLIFYLPTMVFINGLLLGSFVIIYFLILKLWSRAFFILKELTGAIIYAGGVFLIPVALMDVSLNLGHYLLFTQFALIALINLLEFAYFEEENDRQDGHASLVIWLGSNTVKLIIMTVVSLALILNLYTMSIGQNMGANLVLLMMTLTLALIMIFERFFIKAERYRVFGDMVFIFPLLIFLY